MADITHLLKDALEAHGLRSIFCVCFGQGDDGEEEVYTQGATSADGGCSMTEVGTTLVTIGMSLIYDAGSSLQTMADYFRAMAELVESGEIKEAFGDEQLAEVIELPRVER